MRAAYVEKVGAKMLDLFRSYWAAMERLEVSGHLVMHDVQGMVECTARRRHAARRQMAGPCDCVTTSCAGMLGPDACFCLLPPRRRWS